MKKNKNSKQKSTILAALRLLVAALFIVFSAYSSVHKPVHAETAAELRAKSARLQAEIAANEEKAHELGEVAASLQAKVNQLNAEIAGINAQIQLTEVKIAELEIKLKETEVELERQKGLLKASVRALYKKGGASTVELLAASDSFSQFINDQEYLERLKAGIQESAEKVIELKQQIQQQKAEQEELKKQHELQRNLLNEKRAEQQNLLTQTRGEEARYQSLVDSQRKALAEAEAALNRLVYSGNFVSYGPINTGDRLGRMGSTGYSTGAHLHFMVVKNGNTINPRSGGNDLTDNLSWPLPNSGWGNISQEYGCVAPAHYYNTSCNGGRNSFHSGLDITGDIGDPVVAAGAGEIVFRGCQGGLGYVVIINHGGGLFTYYPHMVTPSGQTSGYCG